MSQNVFRAALVGLVAAVLLPSAAWAEESGVGEVARRGFGFSRGLACLCCPLVVVVAAVVVIVVLQRNRRQG